MGPEREGHLMEGPKDEREALGGSAVQPLASLDRPLMGIREWRVKDLELYSTRLGGRWGYGVEEAICLKPSFFWVLPQRQDTYDTVWARDDHPCPSRRSPHECGLYAFYDMNALEAYGDASIDHETNPLREVPGIVSAWGRVVLHAYGFRAQFMRVEAFIKGRSALASEELAARRGVPLLERDEVYAFMALSGGKLGEEATTERGA